ncbi:unnamed protein product [Calypogeia fissa]
MGGEPDGVSAAGGAAAGGAEASVVGGGGAEGVGATVHVRCSNGNKFSVEVDLTVSVRALKALLVDRSEIPADQQRLIYKGRVLKDDNSLDSYGLQNDHTVHLVRGAPASVTTPPNPDAAPTQTPTNLGGGLSQGNPALNPAGLGGLNFPNFGGGGGGYGMGIQEIQQVQQQLMQNPTLMREMMNMPAVQNLMNNPDLMRSIIMSNPQMRDIIDRNPDLAHILNDPGTLRQTLDAARNPELMREMMRNTDRAMSNIEASPEGFNMLRRMYETVQEPLLNAATMGTEGAGDLAGNPFASLLGGQNLGQTQGNIPSINLANTTNPAAATTGTGAPAAAPNTAPLPNPWNPAPAAAPGATGTGTPAAGAPTGTGTPPLGGAAALTGLRGSGGLGGLAGLGLPDFGTAGPFGVDPAMMQQMLQNPAIMQMMQGLLSNPQYINQVLNMQPHLRTMLNSNPQFREMMQSPDFIRQISSPESLQQMMQLQQAVLGQLQGRQPAGQTPTQPGGTPPAGAGMDLNSLLSMFGGLGSTLPTGTPEVNAIPPEQLYEAQLAQLQDMGFFDTQENLRALAATGGNVHAAVERLLRNPG